MKLTLLNRARRSITAKVYLWGSIILLLAFVILAGTTWIVAQSQAQARLNHDLDASLADISQDITHEVQDLAPLGIWFVGQTNLGGLTEARDTAGLAQLLQPLVQVDIVDSITVADAQGAVLARARVDQPTTRGDNILSATGVAEALAGRDSSGFEQDSAGRLQGLHIRPIYAGGKTVPIGVLILGVYLDNQSLKFWGRNVDTELAVVYQDKFVLSSVDQIQGRAWQSQVAPAEVMQAEQKALGSQSLMLDTSKGRYLFKFLPLYSPRHTVVGMYGVGISTQSTDEARATLFTTFGLGLVATVLGMSLVGVFFTRAFTAPIRSLRQAAQGIAVGDLSTPVELKRDDELGDLAQQMERMRQQLQTQMETAGFLKSQYAAAIRSMGVAAVITDQDNRILFLNRAAERLLGQKEASLVRQPWQQLFVMDGNQDQALPLSWQSSAQDGDAQELVIRGRFPLRARHEVILDVLSSSVQVYEEPAGYIHILRNVSEETNILRTQEDFILNVAHELRGPLASLRVSIDLLTEEYSTMSKRDLGVMLKSLRKVINRFEGLVESLIDVGNVQAGRFRVRPVPTSLLKIIDDAIEQTETLRETKGQKLQQKIDPGTDLVLADPPRIVQVLVNLLTNASKYGPEDRAIILSTCRDSGLIHVGVTDQGVGIPPEEQKQIFKRFFRAKRAEEEGAGIGVGLALAKEIVEAHGGKIYLQSGDGRGTTFWFSLPEAQATRAPSALPETVKAGGPDENSLRR